MPEASDGLSDVLRQMAENPGSASPAHRPEDAENAGAAADLPEGSPMAESALGDAAADDDLLLGEVDDEAGDVVAAAPVPELAGAHEAAPRPVRPRRPTPPSGGLKVIAIPILLTVGILMLLWALWGLALLIGIEVPWNDRAGAQGMALVALLAGGPIGLALLASAVIYFLQMQRQQLAYRRAVAAFDAQEAEAAPKPENGQAAH